MPQIGAPAGRFPELQEMILEWEEYPPSGESSPPVTDVFPHSMRGAGGRFEGVLACPNPLCRGGGFEVDFLVESMISERLQERTGLLVCIGWEREQGSRMERTPCTSAIRYRFRLTYRGPVGRATQKGANEKGEAF